LSTTTNTVQVEMAFTDHNERTYKIPVGQEVTPETQMQIMNQIKQKIRAFNSAITTEPNGAVAQTFVSNQGAYAAGIKSGVLVMRQEEVLYNG